MDKPEQRKSLMKTATVVTKHPTFYVAQLFFSFRQALSPEDLAAAKEGVSFPIVLRLEEETLPNTAISKALCKYAAEQKVKFFNYALKKNAAAEQKMNTKGGKGRMSLAASVNRPPKLDGENQASSATSAVPTVTEDTPEDQLDPEILVKWLRFLPRLFPCKYVEDYDMKVSDGLGNALPDISPLDIEAPIRTQDPVTFPYMFVISPKENLGKGVKSDTLDPTILSLRAPAEISDSFVSPSMSSVGNFQLLHGEVPAEAKPKTVIPVLEAAAKLMDTASAAASAAVAAKKQSQSEAQQEGAEVEEQPPEKDEDEESTVTQFTGALSMDALRQSLGISHYDVARYGRGAIQMQHKALSRDASFKGSREYVLQQRERNVKCLQERQTRILKEQQAEAEKKQKSLREMMMLEKKKRKEQEARTSLEVAKELAEREKGKMREQLRIKEAVEQHRKELQKEEEAAQRRRVGIDQEIDQKLKRTAAERNRSLQATVHASETIAAESRALGPMMGKLNETRPVLKRVDERVRQAQQFDRLLNRLDGSIDVDAEAASEDIQRSLLERTKQEEYDEGQDLVRETELLKRQRVFEQKVVERTKQSPENRNRKLDESIVVKYARERMAKDQSTLDFSSLSLPSTTTPVKGGKSSSAETPSMTEASQLQENFERWRAERLRAAEAEVARKETYATRRRPPWTKSNGEASLVAISRSNPDSETVLASLTQGLDQEPRGE